MDLQPPASALLRMSRVRLFETDIVGDLFPDVEVCKMVDDDV